MKIIRNLRNYTHRQGIVFHRFACDVHAVVKLQKTTYTYCHKKCCKNRTTDLINILIIEKLSSSIIMLGFCPYEEINICIDLKATQ